jgi:hypothetical protein
VTTSVRVAGTVSWDASCLALAKRSAFWPAGAHHRTKAAVSPPRSASSRYSGLGVARFVEQVGAADEQAAGRVDGDRAALGVEYGERVGAVGDAGLPPDSRRTPGGQGEPAAGVQWQSGDDEARAGTPGAAGQEDGDQRAARSAGTVAAAVTVTGSISPPLPSRARSRVPLGP